MNWRILSNLVGATVWLGAMGCGTGDHLKNEEADLSQRAAAGRIYQAEDHSYQSGCAIRSEQTGFTGTGYVDYGGSDSLIEWDNIQAPSDGKYTLEFRYANGAASNRRCAVFVNTTNVGEVPFEPTRSWATWLRADIKVTLKKGNNKIRVTAKADNGGPNLDRIRLVLDQPIGPNDDPDPPDPTTTEIKSSVISLPGNGRLACGDGFTASYTDRGWNDRPGPRVPTPRTMYFSACKNGQGQQEVYVSLSLADPSSNSKEPKSGMILRTMVNAGGKLELKGSRHFPECQQMHGIATSANCSTVSALCRMSPAESGKHTPTKDSLATLPGADWIGHNTNNPCATADYGWLYEWKQGQWTRGETNAEPERYIVHKALEHNTAYSFNDALLFGENDNTYAVSVAANSGKNCHLDHSLLVVNLENYDMLPERGWNWGCGGSHASYPRPAYDPVGKNFAVMCTSPHPNIPISFHVRNRTPSQATHTQYQFHDAQRGGGATLRPRPGGGFIGLLVGENPDPPKYGVRPTAIGMVLFGVDGNKEGDIKWLVKNADAYVSYPQLAYLGNWDGKHRYLLGWGVMKQLNNPNDGNNSKSRIIPWEYRVMEIDDRGDALTKPKEIPDVGWGERDEIVSVGPRQVAWAYLEKPTLSDFDSTGTGAFECKTNKLRLSVYTSPTP